MKEGMQEAQKVLRYENMSYEDQLAYKRHIENKRLEISVTETAIYKGARRNSIKVAQKLLEKGNSLQEVVDISELTLEEVQAIARGEDIDKEEEE
jgi:hypothetical protein